MFRTDVLIFESYSTRFLELSTAFRSTTSESSESLGRRDNRGVLGIGELDVELVAFFDELLAVLLLFGHDGVVIAAMVAVWLRHEFGSDFLRMGATTLFVGTTHDHSLAIHDGTHVSARLLDEKDGFETRSNDHVCLRRRGVIPC